VQEVYLLFSHAGGVRLSAMGPGRLCVHRISTHLHSSEADIVAVVHGWSRGARKLSLKTYVAVSYTRVAGQVMHEAQGGRQLKE